MQQHILYSLIIKPGVDVFICGEMNVMKPYQVLCVRVAVVVVRQHKIHFINLVPNLNLQKHVYHIYTAHVISMAIKIFVRPTSMAPSHHFAPADSYEFQAINIINVSLFQPHALFLPLQIEHVTLNDNIVSISIVLLKSCVAT